MKLKFTIPLLLIFFSLNAQNYPFKREIVNDSILLKQKLKELAHIQNEKFIVKHNLDSLKILIKQEIILENYEKAINTIEKYRKELAINNWEGTKLFSAEIYAKSKRLALDKKINFSVALEMILKDKITNIPESLLTNLNKEIPVDISNFEKKKNRNLDKLKDKDSINKNDINSLVESFIDFEIVKQVNKKAKAVFEVVIHEKFDIKTIDITIKEEKTLTVTIIKRKSLKKPLPVVLTNNIYAGDRDYLMGMRAAIRDYVGVVVNTRGKRNSVDPIEPFEHESSDVYEVIDWASKQKWSNGKVGMIGGSYLGFSQWAAVKKIHPALKTIVPQVSVGIGSMDFPMYNNVFANYMLPWISYVTNNNLVDTADFENDAKWISVYNKYYNEGKKFNSLDSINNKKNTIFQKWLKHPSQDDFWEKMVPNKDDFAKINIPILTTTGYYDADQTGALHYFKEHNKYNKKAEHYLLIGPYDHQGAQSFPNNELYGNSLDPVAKINITNLSYDWLDYVLKGKEKPKLLHDKINIQIMGTNKWQHFSKMEQTSNNSLKFYLDTDKTKNSVFLEPKKEKIFTQTVDFKIRNDKKKYYSTGKDSISMGYTGTAIVSETLTNDIVINGSFIGNLKVSINKKDFDPTINLFQIKPDGTFFALSEYLGRASYAKDKKNRQLLTPNTIQNIPVSNTSYMASKIDKGSKLLVVFGVNKSKYWQVNYGTGKDVSEECMDDAKEPLEIKWFNDSYLEIPILQE